MITVVVHCSLFAIWIFMCAIEISAVSSIFAGIRDANDWNQCGKLWLSLWRDQQVSTWKWLEKNSEDRELILIGSKLLLYIDFAYFWSCVNASDRMPLLHAGKAYNGAKLNVLQTSTIPRSPAVIKYSPSRDNNMLWKVMMLWRNDRFIEWSCRLIATYL